MSFSLANMAMKYSASIRDLHVIPIEEIEAARKSLPQCILHTPIVLLNLEVPGKTIYLKLENLQPVGSFKVRGAYNALLNLPSKSADGGVCTSSAGNFGQGLAWSARKHGIPCQVIVPSTAASSKVDALRSLGADVSIVSYDEWWEIMLGRGRLDIKGKFIHPTCDFHVMAGNGTIGLEIYDSLPTVDTVVCAFGGGGHSLGVASALKARNPRVKVYACEVDTAAPLSYSLQCGMPSTLENHKKSFVDGMGGKSVFTEMWNLCCNLLEDSVVVSEKEICEAVKFLLLRNHILAEGAGAATVAAALSSKIPNGNIVCVISGGNIDLQKLEIILKGEIPH